ncbi:hypothetical protein DSL72_007531 [Monilinia vaccinii-corymbosi]|uniref:Acyltransferase 3 domain-containing protein n=1 Tax=Monilinia vaccinii-corymbosi TaxID=61207 RepID=A0A8A3PH90_9HELO|nr:hypothetical protein DSL72_007531 [Monilinia vaccinii-corymbosi]
MPTEYKGILDNGFMEEIKTDQPLSSPITSKMPPNYWKPKKLCPDFIKPLFLSRMRAPAKPLHATAWLDGLRGYAAFLVYVLHHELWAHTLVYGNWIMEMGFGYENKYYFIQLPFLRTFFTGGHFAVTTFFVISGYVLSRKPLMLIQSGDLAKLGDNLASALFRRWLRLWLPVIATTSIYFTIWHVFNIYPPPRSEHEVKWTSEVWKWYLEIKSFSYIFRTGGDPWFTYNVHVWSIPVEIKGSITIYTALMAFSRCSRNARLYLELALIYYFIYIADGIHNAMFVAGMLLCDLDLLAENDDLPRFFSMFDSWKELIFFNFFVAAMYLGGVPSYDLDEKILKNSPGWHYLSYLKPQAVFDYKWFYLFFAATFLVASIPRIPLLKSFFECRLCQYMGHISFAFYLVHGPVMALLGDRLYSAVGWSKEMSKEMEAWRNIFPMSKVGPFGMELSFFLPHLIILPVTLWAAEIVTKSIDEPSVRFAQWLHRKTLAPSPRL